MSKQNLRITILSIFMIVSIRITGYSGNLEIYGNKIHFDNLRISVLTAGLIRVEQSLYFQFCDQPSTLCLNRNFPLVEFDASIKKDTLFVVTDSVRLSYYTKNAELINNLQIKFKSKNGWKSFQFGKTDTANLGGIFSGSDTDVQQYKEKKEWGILSRDGYFLLNDSKSHVLQDDNKWIAREDTSGLDLYFFCYGNNFKLGLKNYVQLTGAIPMLPKWAFGVWYSDYWTYSDEELMNAINLFRKEDIPISVLMIDKDWHLQNLKKNKWQINLFPEPGNFIKWAHRRGMKVAVKSHSFYINKDDSLYNEIAQKLSSEELFAEDYYRFNLMNQSDADIFMTYLHKPLMDQGVDLWWIIEKDSNRFSSESQIWAEKNFYEKSLEFLNGKRALVFGPFSGLGSHRYPVSYDFELCPDWNVLSHVVERTINSGNSLEPYWTPNIGKFDGNQIDPEFYIRWAQFSVMSPITRIHSDYGWPKPWEFDETILAVTRDFIKLRYRLLPYIYSCSREIYETGVPFVRSMNIEWPHFENKYGSSQYMFGTNFLVAPIVEPGVKGISSRIISFPEGSWIDLYTGNHYVGPCTEFFRTTLDRMPLFVKAGAIIPMRSESEQLSAEETTSHLILDVYAGADGSFVLYEDDDETLDYLENKFLKTNLEYSYLKEENDHRICIHRGIGEYSNIIQKRSYEIRMNGIKKPNEVTVNGFKIVEKEWNDPLINAEGGWYYDANYAWAVIKIPAQSIYNENEIIIKGPFSEKDFAAIGEVEDLLSLAEHLTILTPEFYFSKKILYGIKDLYSMSKKLRAQLVSNYISKEDLDREVSKLTRQIEYISKLALASNNDEKWGQRLLEIIYDIGYKSKILDADTEDKDFGIETLVSIGKYAMDCTVETKFENSPNVNHESLSDKVGKLLLHPNDFKSQIQWLKLSDNFELGTIEIIETIAFRFADKELSFPKTFRINNNYIQRFNLIGPFEEPIDISSLAYLVHSNNTANISNLNFSTSKISNFIWKWQLPEKGKLTVTAVDKINAGKNDFVYAITRLDSKQSQELVLNYLSDEDSRIWLNGTLVYQCPEHGVDNFIEEKIPVNLVESENIIVIELNHHNGSLSFSLEVADHSEKTLHGIFNTYVQ